MPSVLTGTDRRDVSSCIIAMMSFNDSPALGETNMNRFENTLLPLICTVCCKTQP